MRMDLGHLGGKKIIQDIALSGHSKTILFFEDEDAAADASSASAANINSSKFQLFRIIEVPFTYGHISKISKHFFDKFECTLLF
jgi:hypothetical protein